MEQVIVNSPLTLEFGDAPEIVFGESVPLTVELSAPGVEISFEVGTPQIELTSAATVQVLMPQVSMSFEHEGAQGPPGLPGPPGPTLPAFVHTQSQANAEWIINHNFGFRPAVELFDTGGSEIDAEVIHVTINQARGYFVTAVAGTARCI